MICILSFGFCSVEGQGVKVEYDKSRDFSVYHTFKLGEGEVITTNENKKVDKAKLNQLIKVAIQKKLAEKGLLRSDSSADLTASYVLSSQDKNESFDMGSQLLGTSVPGNTLATPQGPSKTWSRDYQLGKMIIDLTDKNGNLIWRVNGSSHAEAADNEAVINEVVQAGFKKLSLKPKKAMKKKS